MLAERAEPVKSDENRKRQDCDGSRPTAGADRLLIRPASGRQTGTGLFARTNPRKDTPQAAVSQVSSHKQRARRHPDNSPRQTSPPSLTVT